ncbi:MAG: hypothetical protein IAB76_03500 [Bacteroidetes bacterium]|uniref:N-acetyltransferase n=1 Tax=Candidatus Cryptobacteroides avistercoris TaxID=2840758 RepID=A0A9D9IY26_9BACT|nr:hypothetical protein [Candidatus Cryptobacteroides avistercoris]
MAEYRIVEVLDRRGLRKFIKFPDELYRNCPQYVPALHSDQKKSLTSVSSLSYCSHKLWLALDASGKVVGRICGMINPRYNERFSKKRARFGWFDCIEDFEVARLLIGTAEKWAKAQGMTEIHGPLYYNTLGKQGMLVEGYENIPPFNCIYNYPYYNDFVTRLGFEKECDWVQYKMVADHGVPEKTRRVAKIVRERYNLHFGSIDKLKKDPEQVRKFFKMYNDSFAEAVYNFIPFTKEEIDEEAKSVMPFISDKASCLLMDENDELVAFGISFPSISKALQKAKGHLFPFGWIHLLRALNNYETTDLMLNGAVPQWQHKGVSAIYYLEMGEKSKKIGGKWAITNPQIESNSAVNIWSSYDHELYMRRRCYIKTIE